MCDGKCNDIQDMMRPCGIMLRLEHRFKVILEVAATKYFGD